MISEQQLHELSTYHTIEKVLPLVEDSSYAKLVVPNQNEELPVHRWFRYKEGFSANLLEMILHELDPELCKNINLLDPFCGVGTSLLAAQEMSALGYNISATGIELNPFAAFVARTKVCWPRIRSTCLVDLGNRVLHDSSELSLQIPPLSSLTKGRCISRYMSQRLLAVRKAIELSGSDVNQNALLVGLAATVEPVSRVRKDGRALRIVERPRVRLAEKLKEKWKMIAEDTSLLQRNLSIRWEPDIILGDGRLPTKIGIQPETIDLILTSPPYPNNIDYSEVYKLELWLLGFIQDSQQFLELRKSTFRSHPRSEVAQPQRISWRSLEMGNLNLYWNPC